MVGQNLDRRPHQFDYALVGGGLQNGLLALAIAEHQPNARVFLVDPAERLGSGHTWSFHQSDVAAADERFVEPLVQYRSSSHEVRFEGFSRELSGAYQTVTAERLDEVVKACFAEHAGFELRLGRTAREVSAHHVDLDDGERVSATLVVDARGPSALNAQVAGYQKFVGLELEWPEAHGIDKARLMDASVRQLDGFRFMYVLPFGERRALFEDTYFSDGPDLDPTELRARILDYVGSQGLGTPRVLREERGVLPLPRRLEFARGVSPLRAGYAGGFLHPTTGYSFPVALRLASFLAKRSAEAALGPDFHRFVAEHARQARFAQLLNRLLFQAFEDESRSHVFERFYRLPEPIIARFYALTTTPLDRTRILCGRPPRGISLKRAFFGGPHP
jgi:lycopene beta-cyclase